MAQTQGQPGPEKDGEGGQPGRVGVGWLKSIYGNKKLSLRVLDTVILLGIAALVVVGFLMMQDRALPWNSVRTAGSQVASQKLMYGDLVQRPEDPVKEGYTFEGWYWDDEYKLAWNFDTDTVTGDMYLVAKWAEKDAAGGRTKRKRRGGLNAARRFFAALVNFILKTGLHTPRPVVN